MSEEGITWASIIWNFVIPFSIACAIVLGVGAIRVIIRNIIWIFIVAGIVWMILNIFRALQPGVDITSRWQSDTDGLSLNSSEQSYKVRYNKSGLYSVAGSPWFYVVLLAVLILILVALIKKFRQNRENNP